MKQHKQYIEEEFNPEWDYAVEMATIGRPILNKVRYKIAVHGLNADERKHPNFHIYLEEDISPFSKFNFEIALDEIICYDEINLIRMKDLSKNLDIKNRNKCSWNNYMKLYNDLYDWLYSNTNHRGNFIDNLDSIIYFYNHESGDLRKSNYLLDYIKSHGMKILNKFKKYFSKEDLEKYNDCFI